MNITYVLAQKCHITIVLDMMKQFNAIDNYPFDKNTRTDNYQWH